MAKKAKRAAKKPLKKKPIRKPVAKRINASKKSSRSKKAAAKKTAARAKPASKTKKVPKKPAARKPRASPKKRQKKLGAATTPRKKAATRRAAIRVAKASPPETLVKRSVRVAPPPKPPPPTPEEKERLKAARAQRESEDRQALLFGKAVKLFNSKKHPQALKLFEEVAGGPHPSLRHRAGVYVEICRQRLRPSKVKLKTADEYYNYGIQLVNERRLDEAESQFRNALKMQPRAAHVHLAAAILGALSGDIEKTYNSLKKAIALDPRSRILALNDADLSSVVDEPAIAKLLQGNGASGESI